MKNISIQREIELVHAVKCNRADSSVMAKASYNKLEVLKNQIANKIDLKEIATEVSLWRNQEPIVTDSDIMDLINKKF